MKKNRKKKVNQKIENFISFLFGLLKEFLFILRLGFLAIKVILYSVNINMESNS